MSLLVVVAAAGLLGLAGAVVYFVRSSREPGPGDEAFTKARQGETDSLTRFFIDAAKPLSNLPLVSDEESTLYRFAQAKLLAAGGAYGGQVEVFLAVQVFTALLGTSLMLLTVAGLVQKVLGISGAFGAGVGFLFSFLIGVLPYATVDRKARARMKEISRGLPDFAELLQMPLTAGQGVMAAIEFTARNTSGPVSDEAANVVLLTKTRTLTDAEAFELAGRRLGTPEARAFFNALRQAHVEGSRVVETLGRQAESLRGAQFQRQREELKKVPVRLIVIFALFFLPPVIVLILFNFVAAFQNV